MKKKTAGELIFEFSMALGSRATGCPLKKIVVDHILFRELTIEWDHATLYYPGDTRFGTPDFGNRTIQVCGIAVEEEG